jgi:hypothetical protein
MLKKPSEIEDEYFAKENAVKLYKKMLDQARQLEQEERDRLRELHFMHCPKCGLKLESFDLRGVTVERCASCNGTWLDEGELNRLVGHDGTSLLQRISAVFTGD